VVRDKHRSAVSADPRSRGVYVRVGTASTSTPATIAGDRLEVVAFAHYRRRPGYFINRLRRS
jgi:hypothetical protein